MRDAGEQARPRRRRIWKILGAVLALLVLLLLLAPVIAQPLVKGMVEDAIEDQLAVDATIDELDLSLLGGVTIAGLRLVDERGRDVVVLERAHAELALLRALGGTYAFGAAVDGLVVHVYEEDDGTWSAEKLPRDRGSQEEREKGEPASYDLFGRAELRDARVVLARRDGTAVDVTLAASAAFDGPGAPALLDAAVGVRPGGADAAGGPEGAGGGRLAMHAELPGDPGAWGDLERLTAAATLDVEEPIDLAPLAPAFSAALPVALERGILAGRGEVRVAPGLDLSASAGFTLDGVALRGPRAEAEPLRLERVALDVATASADGGALAPRLELRADDALALVVAGTLTGAGTPDARLTGQLELDGDVPALARLAEGWVAFREGLTLEGALVGAGSFDVALASNALAHAAADLELGFQGLAAIDRAQGPIDLGTLSDPSLAFEARYDAEGGAIDVPRFALDAGPVRAEGLTAVRELGAATPVLGATRVDVTADLDALFDALSGIVVLGNTAFGGTITAHLEAQEREGDLPLSARIQARGLRAAGVAGLEAAPGAAPEELGDVDATLRGTWQRAANAVVLDELTLACTGLAARGSGRVAGLDRLPAAPDVAVDLAVDADPSSLPAWVHAMLGERRIAGADCTLRVKGSYRDGAADATLDLAGRDVAVIVPDAFELQAGSLRAALRATGPRDALVVRGDGELLALNLVTAAPPAEDPGAPPAKGATVVEPRMLFDVDATLGLARGDVELRKLHLESRALSGDVSGRVTGLAGAGGEIVVEGLQGDLTYVPEKLAAALGPLLPGELTGAEPQPCRFRLDGRVRALEPAALLEGLAGTIDVGVGRYRQTGLDVAGDAHVELAGGEATLTSKLKANGGEMAFDGEMQLASRDGGFVLRGPSIALDADDVQANTGLGPLLGFVHPAFAGLQNLQQTEIGGAITCDVALRYEGELDTRTLAAGWDALPKEPIQGSVTFALDAASLVGSPLIQELLAKLDLGGRKDFALKPITLNVTNGRVHYATPWEWTVGGAQTTFGGSIGLDETLDLTWSIPITDEIVARNEYLSALRGRTVEIPLTGSITRPRIEVDDALKGLTKGLLKGAAKDALRGGLEELLGGSGEGEGAEAESEADDPAALLKRADELWKEGNKPAAAEIYRGIREKHKVSLVYALHRDKIKERAAWKP
jgi:hypothetical protein